MRDSRFSMLLILSWPDLISPGGNKELRGVCSPFYTEGFASWELHETEAPAQRPSVSTVDEKRQLRFARIVTPLFPSRLAARGSARNSPRFTKLSSHIGRQTRTDQAANGNTLHVQQGALVVMFSYSHRIYRITCSRFGVSRSVPCCRLLKD